MFPALGIYPVKGNRCERFKKKQKKTAAAGNSKYTGKNITVEDLSFFLGGGGRRGQVTFCSGQCLDSTRLHARR